MMFGVGQKKPTPQVTTVVETGAVRQLVSVSGIAEAKKKRVTSFSCRWNCKKSKCAKR
jgi:hypothetical protein